jgi:hypothetical protein
MASLCRLGESAWHGVVFGFALFNEHWCACLVISSEHGIHFFLGSTVWNLVFSQSIRLGIEPNNTAGAFGVFSTIPGFIAMGASVLSNFFSSCAIGYKAW